MGEYDEDNLQPYIEQYEESIKEVCDPEELEEGEECPPEDEENIDGGELID